MQKGVLRALLNLHQLIPIKKATEKIEFVYFVTFVYNIEMGLNFSNTRRKHVHGHKFYHLLYFLLAVQAACSCSPSLARIAKTTVLRLDGRWRVASVAGSVALCLAGGFWSGGMVENRGGQGLGIACHPCPPT